MPRKGKRKRIANGIYQDSTGRSGIYRNAHGKQREKRFPPDTPIKTIREDIAQIVAKQKGSGRAVSDRGSLNAAIDRWNGLEKHLAAESWISRRAELRAWAALYGHVRLSALTPDDVRKAVGTWTQEGKAAKTIRQRLWTLKHLYHVLHGDVSTPVDDVPAPAKVRRIINPTDVTTILTVYQGLIAQEQTGKLRDAKTRGRFMVRAASGRRPAEIMRAKPEDVDMTRRLWRVRDAKGGWSEGLYLNDDLLMAFQVFIAADAWGAFDTSAQARALRTAGWPEGVRPYNLRHSVGMALSESGVDLADVGGWLGHTDVRTTRSAYVPILQSRMQRAAEAISGRFGGWGVPASVPASPAPLSSKLLHYQGKDHRTKPLRKRA
jgi:integrase